MKNLPLLALTFSLLTGCSILPSTKQRQETSKVADSIATQQTVSIEKAVTLEPPAWIGDWRPNLSYTPPSAVAAATNAAQEPVAPQVISVPPVYRATVKATAGAQQQARSADNTTALASITLPMGVKLILLAIGVILLVVALWLVKRSSAGARAAFEAGDAALANVIRGLRQQAMSSTNPDELVRLNAQISTMESERGKLAGSK